MSYRPISLFFLFLMTIATASADSNQPWSDVASNSKVKARSSLSLLPDQYRLLHLDEEKLRDGLNNIVLSKNTSKTTAKSKQLTLPLPNGKPLTLTVIENSVMAPRLAANYPQIKTYRVDSKDNNGIYGAIDLTEQGFHAMLFMQDGSRLFIDPRQSGDSTFYISYYDKHYHPVGKKPHQCKVKGHHHAVTNNPVAYRTAQRPAAQLKTYRLAMAATGEYTAFHGGKQAAFSAIVTTVNRVNAIYKRDLSIKLELVDNTDALIQTNTTTYTNNNGDELLNENQSIIDRVIGSDNYDIGHVVSTGGGGLASLEATCETGFKAQGTTGSSQPQGDAFDIDFVAHEMGHQFGATHTFNSETENCGGGNRIGATAFEPGSGTSIMAYAGICGEANNIQDNTDAMFHIASMVQIGNYTRKGRGSACGLSEPTVNELPVADAGSDYIIPANTAFELTGSGTDPDKDTLSYSWEQVDAGTASNVDEVFLNNALFRTFLPKAAPTRVIPALPHLLNNTLSKGETLPTFSRELNFSFVVRDGKGGIDADEMKITVQNSDAFRVTSHNTASVLRGGEKTNVTWDVASTNAAPINCSQVELLLSTDGGNTFSKLLANSTVNDGAETVLIPVTVAASSSARIKIKCASNIFFDISNADLTTESLLDVQTPLLSNTGSNQVADPGETISLSIPLVNNSSTVLTTFRGIISTSDQIVITRDNKSFYANIQPSATGVNLSDYKIKIPLNHACGLDVPLTLTTGFTLGAESTMNIKVFDLSIPTGVATSTSQTNSTVQAIPDNDATGISSQIIISGVGGVANPAITVDVDIDHAYRGDVVIKLTSPQGTSVLLKQTSHSDLGVGVKGNFPNTLVPEESLTAFKGENMDGVWTLQVIDAGEEDKGTFNSWTFNYTRSVCEVSNAIPVAKNSQVLIANELVITGTLQATDANGDALNYVLVSNGSKGIATITNASTGTFTYRPNHGETGQDSFTFRVNDGSGNSNIATVSVTIRAANVPPIAQNDVATTDQGQPVTILVLSNDNDADGDSLIITGLLNLSNGTASIVNNQIVYVPNAGFSGDDSFSYTLSDGNGHQVVANVSVTVNAPLVITNTLPVAENSRLMISQDESGTAAFQASDVDGDGLTYVLISNATKGHVVITDASTGVFSYTPDSGKTGQDSFNYQVNDGVGDSNIATVTVTIIPSVTTNNLASNQSSRGSGGSLSWSLFLFLFLLSLVRLTFRKKEQRL